MKKPIKFDSVKSGRSIVHVEGSQVIISEIYYISFSEDRFCHSKQRKPDEMLHHAAFHLGLHCMPKTHLEVSTLQRV